LAACPFYFLQYAALPACYNCNLFAWGGLPPPLSSGACYALATFTSLPLSKHWGRELPFLPSPASLFIYRSCEGVPLPCSPVGLLCFSCFYKPSPLQAHWGEVLLLLPFPADLFITLQSSGHPALFGKCLFFQLLVYYSDFFSLGGGQSVQGAVLICHVPLSSPGDLRLLKQSGSWCLVVREPSWFLHLTWSGDAMHGLGMWRSWSFASSWWFFLPGISPVSLQDFTLGSMLSAFSL
jgi:hypothetical protein